MNETAKIGVKFYWNTGFIPLIILILWSIAYIVISLVADPANGILFFIIDMVVKALLFGALGFLIAKRLEDKEVGHGIKAGIMAGAISGVVAGITNVVSFFAFPGSHKTVIDYAYAQAQLAGAPITLEAFQNMYPMSVLMSVVFSPIPNIIVGLVFSGLAAFIFRKR